MLPKSHILLGFAFACVLVYFFNFSILAGLIIFLSSFLIDIDHYIVYIFKKKDFNLKNAYNYWITRSKKWRKLTLEQKYLYKITPFFFHGIEFILLLLLLFFISKTFLWIFLGVFFHMFIDYVDILAKKDPLYIKASQIYIHITNKYKKEFK